MSDLLILYLTTFAIQLLIGLVTLILAILAAHYWTGSGSFPLVRTLVMTVIIAFVFSLPALWSWSTYFSSLISVYAFAYFPLWYIAICFGFRLDPKETWTTIIIHFPLTVGIALFIYFPIEASLLREYEEKQRQRRREEASLVMSNRGNCTAYTNHRYFQVATSGSRAVAPPV